MIECDDIWVPVFINRKIKTKYMVSNTGKIMNNITGKLIKCRLNKGGYVVISLIHNGEQKRYTVHRLVANAFIPNPENKREVNHIDGNKQNNSVDNLEWVTRTENQQHAVRTGLSRHASRKDGKHLSEQTVRKICVLLEENQLTYVGIAKACGVSRHTVADIHMGKRHRKISKDYRISNFDKTKVITLCGDESVNTIYSDDRIRELCEMIDNTTYSIRELSNMLDIDFQTVRNVYYGVCRKNISKDYNFMKSGVHPRYEQDRLKAIKICELLDTGLNSRQVANQLGIGRPTVRGILAGSTWKDVSKDYNFMKNKIRRKSITE